VVLGVKIRHFIFVQPFSKAASAARALVIDEVIGEAGYLIGNR
jgi:hypothetical protein